MKKILTAAMALPLVLAACSSEEDILTTNNGSEMYPGVAKVNATFGVDQLNSRLAKEWKLENGDQVGFAWLGTEQKHGGAIVGMDGKAYQNHPLTANANGTLVPQTSIYVGKYFSYYPYDKATQSVKEIDFSVENQTVVISNSDDDKYNGAANKSIWISPRLTDVWDDGDGRVEKNEPGVGNTFDVYPRQFTNKVGLTLNYKNNQPTTGTPEIKDIKITYLNKGSEVSVKAFSYAPTKDVLGDWGLNNAKCTDSFWAGYNLTGNTNVDGAIYARSSESLSAALEGVTPREGAIVLTPSKTYFAEGTSYKFYYNALPASQKVTDETMVKLEIATTYGDITIEKPVSEVAWTYVEDKKDYMVYPDGVEVDAAGKKLADDKKVTLDNSFIQTLYKTGKIETEVDFYTAIMNGMHVADDAELQKILNYYYAYKLPSLDDKENDYSESETGVTLYLDGTNHEFKISKTSLALIQKINSEAVSEYGYTGEQLMTVEACEQHSGVEVAKNVNKVILTRSTESAEVPNLNNAFSESITKIYLAGNTDWTVAENTIEKNIWGVVTFDGKRVGNIAEVINEGTLTITEDLINVDAESFTLKNSGQMNINAVVYFQEDMENNGIVTIKKGAELLAEGPTVTNEVKGKITNNGVIGVVSGTNGDVNNYGYIKNNTGAKTYITNNQTNDASFGKNRSETNKLGTIELTTPADNVSVSANTNQGFIKYTWNGGAVYATPEGDVRYNYLIVKSNIKFTEDETEIEYIEIAGTSEVVITAENATLGENSFNTNLKGFIVKSGSVANIKEGNSIGADAAHIAGKLYLGGTFEYGDKNESYNGTWAKKNIIEH